VLITRPVFVLFVGDNERMSRLFLLDDETANVRATLHRTSVSKMLPSETL